MIVKQTIIMDLEWPVQIKLNLNKVLEIVN